jgi:hypothetical protein
MYPLNATVDWRVRRYVLVVEYGVINLLRGHRSFFYG